MLGIGRIGLLRLGVEIILRYVPRHFLDAAIGELHGTQHMRILRHKHLGDFRHTAFKLRARHGFIHQPRLRRLLAAELLAGEKIILRIGLRHLLGDRARHVAGRDNAPVDFRQAEHRLVRRNRKIARHQRRERAAEAPAVDHGNRRLREEHQPPPLPAHGFALHAHDADRRCLVDFAEIFLDVHAGGERVARAGQHQHLAAVIDLQHIEHIHHVAVETRRHGVALVGAVERHPGNAVLEFDLDVIPHRQL